MKSKRDIPMFFDGEFIHFVVKCIESPDEFSPGVAGFDDFIDKSSRGCPIWVGECIGVFLTRFKSLNGRVDVVANQVYNCIQGRK